MNIVGIIAEYNPMHNGHVAQIEYAKKVLDADYIVVAMSGDFTQRGIPAVMDKYERARIALMHGADLVIEMPVVGATASASEFARCGVSTLVHSGIVTHLLFGAENADRGKFERAATLLENESFVFRKTLKELLKSGETFAAARAKAMDEAFPGEGFGDFLSSPNNILGVEYIRAIKALGSPMEPHPMQRIDDGDRSYTSSSQIREFLQSNDVGGVEPFVSDISFNALKSANVSNLLAFRDDFSLLLHDRLLRSNDFSMHMDGDNDLSRRVLKLRQQYVSFGAFADRLKTRNITHSHIMRFLNHILLFVSKEDHALLKEYSYAPYIHVLDFKIESQELLSMISDATDTVLFRSPQEASKLLDAKAWTIFSKDIIASDVYRIVRTQKSGYTFPNEYTRHFEPF